MLPNAAIRFAPKLPHTEPSQIIAASNISPIVLRNWQLNAYKQLKNEPYGFCIAYCGSGKTILQLALSIYDVVHSNWRQKQLIVVPQQHIGDGFATQDRDISEYISITLPDDGQTYEWAVRDNFCRGQDVLNKLKDWLLMDSDKLSAKYHIPGEVTISGLNAVASHQALGLVWSRLSENEKLQAIKNLTLRPDEAHHIKGMFSQDNASLSYEDMTNLENESTWLGEICRFILNNGRNNKICLTTATPYRGDKGIILDEVVKEKFSRYILDWLEHWATLNIEEFTMGYEEYDEDPISLVVEKIKSEPNQKHMVIIPSSTHKWRPIGNHELEELLANIYTVVPQSRVLDLVTKETQARNKQFLLNEPKTDSSKSKYDVIVTCMLGREGTDWCPCSRLHNTACENSVTLAVQTMGRAFRKFQGKNSVKVTYYVQRFPEPSAGMTKRELLSDRTNALLICIQMDEFCHPIFLPALPQDKNSGTITGKVEGDNKRVPLGDIFKNWQCFKEELIEGYEGLEEKTDETVTEFINELIDRTPGIDERHLSEHRDWIIAGLKTIIVRRTKPLKELPLIDIEFMREQGFDKITEQLKNKSIFFTGDFETDDWQTIRSILKENRPYLEQRQAELLAAIREGKLDKAAEELIKEISPDEDLVRKMVKEPVYAKKHSRDSSEDTQGSEETTPERSSRLS